MTQCFDPVSVASYADKTVKIVPGLQYLHKMACVLLAERAPAKALILVLGAGGGLECRIAGAMSSMSWADAPEPKTRSGQYASVGALR